MRGAKIRGTLLIGLNLVNFVTELKTHKMGWPGVTQIPKQLSALTLEPDNYFASAVYWL